MNEVEKELLNYFGEEKNKIIFDVGCFRGNFTRNIIKYESKKGIRSDFFLFDPNPKVKDYLSSLLKENNVKCFNIAFDNSNSKKKFTLNQYFEASGSSLVSLHKEDKLYNFTRKSFMKIFQPFKKIKDYVEIDVQTKTIDIFCEENKINYIHLLKLDTEGNEFNILNRHGCVSNLPIKEQNIFLFKSKYGKEGLHINGKIKSPILPKNINLVKLLKFML